MNPIHLEALLMVFRRQKLLLKTARYLALIGEQEYLQELTEVDDCLKKLEASDAG